MPERYDEIRKLQNAITRVTASGASLPLYIGDTEYFIPVSDILFFETEGDKVAAHTDSGMYYTDKKLYELEKVLPDSFVRASKSCILDSAKVSSVSNNLTGSGEVQFANSRKKTYVSRMYCKSLRDTIYETRISK